MAATNDQLVQALGKHLQTLRKSRKLTLEALSKKSGVSRSMLSQIERGQANPTFATLWNLSHALGLEMSELVEELESSQPIESSISYLTAANTPRISNANNGCTLQILAPPQLVEHFEWYDLKIRPNGALISQAHAQGCREHLTVLSGKGKVISAEDELTLNAGDTARYPADVPHSIFAIGTEPLHAILVVLIRGTASGNF
ncbi:MAG: helix-turn-helix domain-containing protein [Candidatus Promineifilaceae bacterium]